MNSRSSFAFSLVSFLLLSLPAGAESGLNLQPGLDLFDGGKYPEAQAFFQKLSLGHPENATVAYYMGRSYYQSSQIKKAVESMEKAVKLDARNAEYHYLLGMAYARYINEVGMFSKLGVARKMKKSWLAAADCDKNHKDSQIAVIGFYLNAPGVAGGSIEEAAKQLTLLKQRYPDETFSMEGLLAEKKEEHIEAEKAYRKTVEKNPTPRNLFGLASYLSREKQFDEAAKLFKEYLARDLSWNDHSKASANYMLGSIFADKKMNAEAKEAFQAAKAESKEKLLNELIDRKIKELDS